MSKFAATATAAGGPNIDAEPTATKAISSRWRCKKTRQYAQIDQLLLERNSLRSIARATGVARNTIAKRVKKSAAASPVVTPAAAKKT